MEKWLILRNRWLILLHDIGWVPAAVLLAYWLRFNLESIPSTLLGSAILVIAVAVPVHAFTFWFFGCYRGIWRFASIPDLFRLVKAVLLGTLIAVAGLFLYNRLVGIPRSVLVLYPMLLLFGISASRLFYRILKDHTLRLESHQRDRALIVGAGRAGDLLVRDLIRSGTFSPVGFVDDDRAKQGHELQGVRVLGKLTELPSLLGKLNIDVVVIAMPSASRQSMDRIVKACAEAGVKCRTLPSLAELADGRVEVSRLRPVTVEDILGREPVVLDEVAISSFLKGKRVMVTGGGGSIGSELCRQVLKHEPGRLIIVDSSEYNLYQIENELQGDHAGKLKPLLGDVKSTSRMSDVFERYQPQVVFHAAAYKHVPLVEHNPVEGVCNNVLGTKVVADLSVKYEVETFVLISTDKTVNPTNVMGASKRLAELYCQTINNDTGTHFVTTRFGNVLASAGSVVPLFEKQIQAGGPVTVTHKEITRYFMTIPEAASLILQAGAMGKGGEIYVLDMGEPVRIRDLAEKMIQLSGLQPGRDIQITYTGLRPGEKMYEELFYGKEELLGTSHPKLMLANCYPVAMDWLVQELRLLENALNQRDAGAVVDRLKVMIPEFAPTYDARAEMERSTPNLRVVK